jgi:hypothetical protein
MPLKEVLPVLNALQDFFVQQQHSQLRTIAKMVHIQSAEQRRVPCVLQVINVLLPTKQSSKRVRLEHTQREGKHLAVYVLLVTLVIYMVQ